MTEAFATTMPPGGWTVDDLDRWPESQLRHELTDGALTVSPSASNLHQSVQGRLFARLDELAPDPLVAAQIVEIRFGRQLTRIPDVLVVHSDEPRRHWFAPSEVLLAVEIESPGSHTEDRVTKPAIYAQHGIPAFWRIELEPLRVRIFRQGEGDSYREVLGGGTERLKVTDPFDIDIALVDLLPRWAR
ncbi:Uma2 family endonuclease [Pseudonocardia sp. TRM90224]|uniref:Uma2 family endonuclease n=1 Tax=Pseudonocardia sp. TRM90224 TaxID=2812678 RepID=UPI001E390B4C|nr:Uma2 family endonuclease [Pseudonocardia sp. TRM90224]